ncbi:hypothetical protein HPP92_022777 [Vanilla planifolia]|uniref:Golgin candidate 4 n=1 Tax=Vanilla planifolia TaxID=51239 RepID=A0A835PTW5_VANPL|nr:hypothetical protein HPP92_022777 [Vanilla planifolia]
MRNSIASYKESLSRIAHEVLDTDVEDSMSNGPVSARQIYRDSVRSTPTPQSRQANGTDPGFGEEIAKYRADIQKLQASEAEIKALSFNYAALLKEKEEELLKLRQENGSLRKCMEEKIVNDNISRGDNTRILSNSPASPKGNLDQNFIKSRRVMAPENSRSGHHSFAISTSKQNGFDDGTVRQIKRLESSSPELICKENEKLLNEVKSLKAFLANHEAEMNLLKEQLEKDRATTSLLSIKLQEEHELYASSQQEVCRLQKEMEKNEELKEELDKNLSELRRLQIELSMRDMEKEENESLESLKSAMQMLEKENAELKIKKNELEAKLNGLRNGGSVEDGAVSGHGNAQEIASKVVELEEVLEVTCKERDKALQELSRLKQHLLDKELEEEDKMDEDIKIIEELRAMTEYQKAQLLHLENALTLERAKMEELKKLKKDELHRSNETVKELDRKLTNCMRVVDAKNVELQNLQTALGQYYAESEAKERFGRELAMAREESSKLAESLKVANECLEESKRDNEEANVKLLQTERLLSESRSSLQKLQEDNSKLRHALEQSMTTLNRMSLDSDNYVDRRIVIKLLVTYFQRNHSKEVLDLIVRMLGFSEEDKQRVGVTQHSTGKGVVRGVLGLPGRLVGGFLGGNKAESFPGAPSDNQSFADLWVDFLLKETEERERERREASEVAQTYSSDLGTGTISSTTAPPGPNTRALPTSHFQAKQVADSVSARQYRPPPENVDAKFSTVPLTLVPSVSPSTKSSHSNPSPRY